MLSHILSALIILSLYAFPMSFAETWAFGDPRKAKKQANGDEASDPDDDWTKLSERLPQWLRKVPRVPAGLAAGGCLMVVVVILGAVAFALYYLLSDQPERISQIVPRFAYWFPFALLGMVTDIPFQIIYWENKSLRVFLRLAIWWFPRLVIIAFVINPPLLQGLDPAATALVVLAIDGILVAFCLGLYAAREQMAMKASA